MNPPLSFLDSEPHLGLRVLSLWANQQIGWGYPDERMEAGIEKGEKYGRSEKSEKTKKHCTA